MDLCRMEPGPYHDINWNGTGTIMKPDPTMISTGMEPGPYLDPLDWLGVLEWELSPAELLPRSGEEEEEAWEGRSHNRLAPPTNHVPLYA